MHHFTPDSPDQQPAITIDSLKEIIVKFDIIPKFKVFEDELGKRVIYYNKVDIDCSCNIFNGFSNSEVCKKRRYCFRKQ